MGYFSEDSNKSIMRIGFFVCIIVGCVLAAYAVAIWSVSIIYNINHSPYFTDKVDISEIKDMVLVLLGVGTGGKVGQKIIEQRKTSKEEK